MKKLGIDLYSKPRNQSECDRAMAEAESEMGNINQYSIYVDVCTKFGNGNGKRYTPPVWCLTNYVCNVEPYNSENSKLVQWNSSIVDALGTR